ncbi:glycosyltransferase family 4 protein [Leptolyngbya ohadii]|uniref:glycosyltransferase family 4 protein n=1 Tax=Leptolyngbya ohadii TaxID=1962290 RepID=UPI000B59D6A2|nr:glycosyltransferase family 4 protein [Leptolyngbya ohadii]
MQKLAIITSHPIQYYAPWFRYLANQAALDLRVFYLWNFGIGQQSDPGFQQVIEWDIPLLEGYDFEFVPNLSDRPGTQHFWGLHNPTLLQQVRQYQPDGVLMMNYNYASLYHFLWHWHETPIVFRGDSHRLVGDRGVKPWLKQQWISQIFRRFAACLYVGKANYHYFQSHGIAAERLFFSPHAVENDRFIYQTAAAQAQAMQWKQELGIPANHAVILFAGKLIPKKRPIDLLQAFLQANLPQVSLLFVGNGELENELRTKAALHPHVYFAPFQNQSWMPRAYAIADLVVLPSYGSGETWGLAINEAMCLSKAVLVSSHVGCAADLVQPGRNGLVFPAGNVRALAEALQTAFDSADRLSTWGQESRRIISHYSYAQTTQGLLNAMQFTTNKECVKTQLPV